MLVWTQRRTKHIMRITATKLPINSISERIRWAPSYNTKDTGSSESCHQVTMAFRRWMVSTTEADLTQIRMAICNMEDYAFSSLIALACEAPLAGSAGFRFRPSG